MKELINKIRMIAGDDKAAHYETVILPNIVMDFYGMIQRSATGSLVSEEYRMEDNSMKIILNGMKDNKGRCRVTKTEVLN
ncbi:MAG: hypothetical protein IKP31_07615 [Lachnospiraceae bacterium]|nr:hypothetical protein [Lachnospiraceae bacterium]